MCQKESRAVGLAAHALLWPAALGRRPRSLAALRPPALRPWSPLPPLFQSSPCLPCELWPGLWSALQHPCASALLVHGHGACLPVAIDTCRNGWLTACPCLCLRAPAWPGGGGASILGWRAAGAHGGRPDILGHRASCAGRPAAEGRLLPAAPAAGREAGQAGGKGGCMCACGACAALGRVGWCCWALHTDTNAHARATLLREGASVRPRFRGIPGFLSTCCGEVLSRTLPCRPVTRTAASTRTECLALQSFTRRVGWQASIVELRAGCLPHKCNTKMRQSDSISLCYWRARHSITVAPLPCVCAGPREDAARCREAAGGHAEGRGRPAAQQHPGAWRGSLRLLLLLLPLAPSTTWRLLQFGIMATPAGGLLSLYVSLDTTVCIPLLLYLDCV